MKYRILLVFLLLNFIKAYDRNSMFVGIGFGLGDNITIHTNKNKKTYSHSFAPSWGLVGGYEYKPLRVLGIRAYLQSLMDLQPNGLETIISNHLSLNVDVSTNIVYFSKEMTLGAYAGAGVGFSQYQKVISDPMNNKFHTVFLVNVGIEFKIDDNNRVQLGIKFPSNIKFTSHTTLAYIYSF
ncbi:outer membrane beta-barrel protein [Helicobacter anatolicus]|uniref:outer membrane beta-barrel protein n=1 Tax=Helicobacter anatolicus TaxID=2905874 RepID=UPI001E3CC769|nr:outer membrane beta-barrel protein [Helicobacter anatolicus]MCE3038426.1 outer membrane protein [Helicobacter anatolicus]